MLAGLLLASAAFAAPAKPPPLESDPRDVQSADNRLYQGIDGLLATPVEPARLPRLKDQADEIAAAGGSLLAAARDAAGRLYPAADFAGDFGPGADSRFSDAWNGQQRLARRVSDG